LPAGFLPRSPIWPANCGNTSAPTPNPPDPFAGLILTPGAASVLTKSPGQLTSSSDDDPNSSPMQQSMPAPLGVNATRWDFPLRPSLRIRLGMSLDGGHEREASPCFLPTLPPRRKSRMRINDRLVLSLSRLLHHDWSPIWLGGLAHANFLTPEQRGTDSQCF